MATRFSVCNEFDPHSPRVFDAHQGRRGTAVAPAPNIEAPAHRHQSRGTARAKGMPPVYLDIAQLMTGLRGAKPVTQDNPSAASRQKRDRARHGTLAAGPPLVHHRPHGRGATPSSPRPVPG